MLLSRTGRLRCCKVSEAALVGGLILNHVTITLSLPPCVLRGYPFPRVLACLVVLLLLAA